MHASRRPFSPHSRGKGSPRTVPRHVFDGGRSRAVRQGLKPLLDEVREQLEADVGIALHASNDGRLGVLVAAGARSELLPLANEEVRFTDMAGRSLATTEPRLVQDVVLTSLSRPFRLACSSALVVPWSDGTQLGLLVIGVSAGPWLGANLSIAQRYGRLLGTNHRDASYRGTVRLADDLAAACKAIDHAELEATESGEMLAAIAGIARSLMGTPTAYIAMPDIDAFPFTTLVGIRTSAFRRLRMGPEQGLGGFARREGTTVHTTHYSGDGRLRQAPVKETLEEGIVSAICTPLIVDGQIAGTLYLGERQPRAFSDADTELLDDLAEHIGMCLNRQNIEEHRLSALRNRERDRLASAMHDSVVRSLVEIGYHAEEGCMRNPNEGVRSLLEAIGATAGTALEQVRSDLFSLGGRFAREEESCVGELVETLRLVTRRPEVRRSFHLVGLERDTVLPDELLDALISVGEEALVNAERHSDCTTQEVTLERTGADICLTVVDDGAGIDALKTDAALSNVSGHLGIRSMRAVTRALGGQTQISMGPLDHGTQVLARIPHPPAASA